MGLSSIIFDTLKSLPEYLDRLANRKHFIGACGAIALAGSTAASGAFIDDFSADTSANYTFEDSYGGGGSFEISGGTLNVASSGNNTATATTSAAVPFTVGESLGVDAVGLTGSAGVFLTLGENPGQPSGSNDGYRWRRDINGLRPQAANDGILIVSPDPDPTSNATLWIDRTASDTFEFLFQLEGESTRSSIYTDNYPALAGLTDLHIGVQHFGGSPATRSFDNLRIVATSSLVPEPGAATVALIAFVSAAGGAWRRTELTRNS